MYNTHKTFQPTTYYLQNQAKHIKRCIPETIHYVEKVLIIHNSKSMLWIQ